MREANIDPGLGASMRGPTIWITGLLLLIAAFVTGYVQGRGAKETNALPASYFESTRAALAAVPLDARARSLTTLFTLASIEDFDGIADAYESTHIGAGPGAVETELLGGVWGRLDPPSGVARAASWRTFWNRQTLSPLMRAWARTDLEGALAASAEIEDAKTRSLVESSIALGYFASGGDAAWEAYKREWPFGDDVFPEVVATIVQREGIDRLFERFEALSDETPVEFRVRFLRIVVGLGGRIDPETTAPFVAAHADDEIEGLRNLKAPFVDAWAQSDPRAALDWLMDQPASGQRTVATRIAFRPWIYQADTRHEAIAWIEGQPPIVRAPVQDFYAMALLHVDHTRAIEAAKQISGPNRDVILARVKKMIAVREKRDQKTLGAANPASSPKGESL